MDGAHPLDFLAYTPKPLPERNLGVEFHTSGWEVRLETQVRVP